MSNETPTRTTVFVRYFAGAAAAAGVEEESVALAEPATLGRLTAAIIAARPALGPVFEVASLLVDGVTSTDAARPLSDGQQVDVLPPFAGG